MSKTPPKPVAPSEEHPAAVAAADLAASYVRIIGGGTVDGVDAAALIAATLDRAIGMAAQRITDGLREEIAGVRQELADFRVEAVAGIVDDVNASLRDIAKHLDRIDDRLLSIGQGK